eukprot:6194175-Pleurochrysis_carterae.AAC.1
MSKERPSRTGTESGRAKLGNEDRGGGERGMDEWKLDAAQRWESGEMVDVSELREGGADRMELS